MRRSWLVLLFCLAGSVLAGNWPRFRGPNGTGHSPDRGLVAQWDDTHERWRTALPGDGHSSPVIWNDRLYVTAAKENQAWLLALDVHTGRVLWQKDSMLSAYRMNTLNHYAAGTPACDADGVYVIWATAADTQVVALDHEGKPRWNRSFGPTISRHGPCKSPMLHGSLLVFTMEQRPNAQNVPSAWYALDTATGQTRWRLSRNDSDYISYSTPCVYTPSDGPDQLVFSSLAHGLTGVEAATGQVLWEEATACPERVVACPIVAGDLILATCGEGGTGRRLTAVRPPAPGSTDPVLAYVSSDSRIVPYVPTMLAVEDLIFAFHDLGPVTCFDAATGNVLWSEKPGGRFYCSGVFADGKVFCANMDGQVVVLRASREYELLGVNDLGEKTFATPAIVEGRLYARTASSLKCIDLRQHADRPDPAGTAK